MEAIQLYEPSKNRELRRARARAFVAVAGVDAVLAYHREPVEELEPVPVDVDLVEVLAVDVEVAVDEIGAENPDVAEIDVVWTAWDSITNSYSDSIRDAVRHRIGL